MQCADATRAVIGWDVGGANIKASLLVDGRVRDVAQCPAPLWQGMHHLDNAVGAVRARWPEMARARHAVTMTAEMTDLFVDRESGVLAVAERLGEALGDDVRYFAGAASWPQQRGVGSHWRDIASANWRATALLVGSRLHTALLVDIGSTTTDLVPVSNHAPCASGRGDAERLAAGELVYVGVVRTPLCALASRIAFGDHEYNVMNELFATTADVFRITGELDPLHDQHAAADGGDKGVAASHARLARMIGMDAREASPARWDAFARTWREHLLERIAADLRQVARDAALPARAPIVGAGCGMFLARTLAERLGRPFIPFQSLAGGDLHDANWASTCAPSVAVALLFDSWSSTCG